MYLGQIQISEAFKNWVLKYRGEFQAGDNAAHVDIIQAQQKANQECLRRLDNLVKLKTSPANTEGSLLSDEEYGQQRAVLLKEKAAFTALLCDAGSRVAQSVQLAQETFEFAANVQRRFVKGDVKTKKEILTTVGSNLKISAQRIVQKWELPC